MNFSPPTYQQSAEMKLLLNAYRALCNQETINSFEKLLYEKLNWDKVILLARAHGMAPIVYYVLTKIPCNGSVPEKALGILKFEYYLTAEFNLRLYKILGSILRAFKQYELSIILVKGPLLAYTMYPHVALRPMSDIDILIKKEEADKVNKVLNELGYRCEPVRKWLLMEYYCLEYYHLKEPKLEVHWELFLPEDFQPEDFQQQFIALPSAIFWNSAQLVTIDGNQVSSLSDELHLLYLCLHMAKHFAKGEFRFIWACDISLICQKKSEIIDWTQFWQLAADSGQKRLVHEVLKFVHENLGAAVKIGDSKPDFRYFTLRYREELSKTELHSKRIFQRIFRIPGIWAKFYSLLGYFFPNCETLAWKYATQDRKKLILLHVAHPFCLLWRGMKEYIRK